MNDGMAAFWVVDLHTRCLPLQALFDPLHLEGDQLSHGARAHF